MIEFNHHKDRQENVVVTINSTLISGAGAIPAIAPLLTGKKKLLLVSDGNVIKLAATQQILTLLQAGRLVQIIDNVPPEPSQHDVARILADRQTRHLIWSSVSAAAAFSMSANCYRYFVTRALRALTPCWPGKSRPHAYLLY
jgi:hypothetical protein